MTHIFPRHCQASSPVVMRGDGVYLFDHNGKRYLDGSGGAAVSCLGHSDADVVAAIKAQLDKVAYAHTSFFTSDPAEELADRLIASAPEGIGRVYFVSGGSEAIEAALKLARQYFIEKGQPDRHRIIAREQSYHGNTLGALATGGNQWRKRPFAPLMIETSHIPPCYEYRGREAGESSFEYGQRVAEALETEILRLGPKTVAAFVAEPVVGATLGAVPAVEGYFKRIRQICDRYGILLILDEVMCGMGRCGTLFACEQEPVHPDIVTIAKGLGAGYQPIGAMMCSGEIYAAIESGSGFFQHGHTYIGHPVACSAANAVVKKLVGGGVVEQSRIMGARLKKHLIAEFGQHPYIGDIRGRGLFVGLEIVQNRETKAPFDPEQGVHKAIKKAAFEAGLACYSMGGTIDGIRGDHILLAPPFILEDNHIYELTDKLQQAFRDVF
ncbi:aspartate aminotransferase family protein [Profundibacter sp.]